MPQPRIITALITPFINGEVDHEGLRRLLSHQLEGGVEGVLILGTTGESPTITRKERRAIIATAVEHIGGKIPVMVGTGTNSTQSTIELTEEARQLGVDMALVVTPYYNCPTQNGIFDHFAALSQASSLPVCIYNIPKRTGRIITVDTLKKLATLPNIIGVKESTGDLSQSSQIMQRICAENSRFTLWCGDDVLTLPIMSIGGHGVISVASNVAPREICNIVFAAAKGDFSEARRHFYRNLPLLDALFIETNPIPVKAAMEMCDLPAGPCRLPLSLITPKNQQKLEEALIQCKMLTPQLSS